MVALDSFDLRILARQQRDALTPAHVIGADIGLSAAAVQRRLKRLREAGVIERETAQVAPAAVGMDVTCIVHVDLERETAADIDRFARDIAACPEVQQCYYVTGSNDFVLITLARDIAAYEAFTQRVLLADRNVKSFTTQVVLKRLKVGLEVPLAHDADQ
jgi:Lrp/AsnC family leucine-responsive transcriptional regulator